MNGIMQFADPRWLAYHHARPTRDLVVYYASPNKRSTQEALFCVLKGTPPRTIAAVGRIQRQREMSPADAWREYGPALGADTENGWQQQAKAVLDNSQKSYGGMLLVVELVDFREYSKPVTLDDVGYVGETAWGNMKKLDAETTRKLLGLLDDDNAMGRTGRTGPNMQHTSTTPTAAKRDLFVVGQCYSRRDVQEIVGVPEERRGGNWDTGYTSYEGSVYVFCNVGTAGRTGHDYPNRWVGDALQWSAKNGSLLRQPSTRELLTGNIPVHVFWRDEDRKPFCYAGVGRATDVRDESPVRLTWEFDDRAEWHPERPAEEVQATETYPEGALKRVTVNAYERSPQARARCIEHYGAVCQVCGFDFQSTYGDIGAGFIHVHHLVELADLGGEYTVDPIKDLRPVCPNCHAMLHRKRPAYTPLQLSALMGKSSTSDA